MDLWHHYVFTVCCLLYAVSFHISETIQELYLFLFGLDVSESIAMMHDKFLFYLIILKAPKTGNKTFNLMKLFSNFA